MLAYFNELSAEGSILKENLQTTINTFVECLKILKEKNISGISLDKKIGHYQLTATRWFQDVLDDKSIVDSDTKSLILGMMTTVENGMVMQATCEGKECIGFGLASEDVNNTFAVSLFSVGWDEPTYKVEVRLLDEDDSGELIEQTIETKCKNVSVSSHIEEITDLFSPLIPSSGLELLRRLKKLFPNLVFSSKAKEQIKKIHDRPSIEQIYLKLQDTNKAAQKLNGGCLNTNLFQYKASPEHQQRRNLPEMSITFDDGNTRNCEWHLRYTPGCGRIHFSSDKSDGHTIYVGHIDGKIGVH